MTENWLPISGYVGYYEISDHGRVKSLHREPYRILKPFPNGSGHLLVDLRVAGTRRTVQVHLLAMHAFVGPPPEGMECRHLNGDPQDNRLENLQYGTRSENIHDSVRHGTHNSSRVPHCPKKHPYDAENTYVNPRKPGSRTCRTCMREANQAYRHRQKNGLPAVRRGRPRTQRPEEATA